MYVVKTFLQLTKIYELLSSKETREAYDRTLRVVLEKKVRDSKLDAKRRALRDDLLERENAAKKQRMSSAEEDAKLKAEIDRLRQDGLRRVREMNETLWKSYQPTSNVPAESRKESTVKHSD